MPLSHLRCNSLARVLLRECEVEERCYKRTAIDPGRRHPHRWHSPYPKNSYATTHPSVRHAPPGCWSAQLPIRPETPIANPSRAVSASPGDPRHQGTPHNAARNGTIGHTKLATDHRSAAHGALTQSLKFPSRPPGRKEPRQPDAAETTAERGESDAPSRSDEHGPQA